jgi:hypothetical protein
MVLRSDKDRHPERLTGLRPPKGYGPQAGAEGSLFRFAPCALHKVLRNHAHPGREAGPDTRKVPCP